VTKKVVSGVFVLRFHFTLRELLCLSMPLTSAYVAFEYGSFDGSRPLFSQ
jgi:hypothetical protein